MGAMEFQVKAKGYTPREAFDAAVQEAIHEYGHGPYSGTIKEKDGYVEISVPKGKGPYQYADELMQSDDRRISNKWGPAGCILLESEPTTEEVPYATTQDKYEQKGSRKWETVFRVIRRGGFMESDELLSEEKSQTDAEKYAKQYVKNHNRSVRIRIEKKLVNGEQDIMIIRPKTKEVKSSRTLNTYLFFGLASS